MVIDIDLKVGTFKLIADKLLVIFKNYYKVKTPSGGYHIYAKVKSEDKFKSQHLITLGGEKTTIEILGEKKKAMGPGSLIDGKMYSRAKGKSYKNSRSSKTISREEFMSKLKEAGLLIGSLFKDYDHDSVDVKIIETTNKNRLIGEIIEARLKKESIKFISPVHGSKSNLPNTTLNVEII